MIDLKGISLIVAGFPRSGTSMIMRMLLLAGIEILADQELQEGRFVNMYDPYGVLERKDIGTDLREHDSKWTANKAFKLVTPYIPDFFPMDRPVKVLFTLRDQTEIITSLLAKKSLWAMDIAENVAKARHFLEWFKIPTLYLKYNEVVKYPKTTAMQIQSFLDVDLDIAAMAKGADPNARQVYKEKPDLTQRPDGLLSLNPKDYNKAEFNMLFLKSANKGTDTVAKEAVNV
jgi:hypothetical protein